MRLLFTLIFFSAVLAEAQQKALVLQHQKIALRKYGTTFKDFQQVGLSFTSLFNYDRTKSERDTTFSNQSSNFTNLTLTLSIDRGRKLFEGGGEDPRWTLYIMYGLSVSPIYYFSESSMERSPDVLYDYSILSYGGAVGVNSSLELQYRFTERLFFHNDLDIISILGSARRNTTKRQNGDSEDNGWSYSLRTSVTGDAVSLSSLGLIYYF